MRTNPIFQFVVKRKIASALIAVALLGVGYGGYSKFFASPVATKYVTADVQKGTLVVSISGSGQVSASNQLAIKPKVAGDVVYVGVKNGQAVGAGTLIAQLDARDAQKSVRDAEANLESAQLTLAKFKNSTYDGTAFKAEGDVKKAIEDGFNSAADAFLDIPGIMTGLDDILFATTLNSSQWNIDFYENEVLPYDERARLFRDSAYSAYRAARVAYDAAFADYKATSRFSDDATIETLIGETYETTKTIAEAVKSANNLIQFYQDKMTEHNKHPQALSTTNLATLNTYTGKVNAHLSNLQGIQTTIRNDRDALLNAPLDVQAQELAVKRSENALQDAKEKLADYFVRAPFSGTIAQLSVKRGDSVSSATALGTLVTKSKLAEISLNEVDIARIRVGQKATLTFDAVQDLTIAGTVADVDALGTVSQGVVTYAVKIAFDTNDERVKPAMSVSAAIIIDAKQNVLLAPNSAVKSQGAAHYVEIVEGADAATPPNASGVVLTNAPRRQIVEIGLSNDEFTEITSGVKEGDRIVARTIQATTASASTNQSSSGLRIPGIGGGGGGARSGAVGR